ncbi:MAG: CusA/CzcA family heavy metal efflux RND transporter [Nitrospira sp.]|nr:CusA/CzcA family heavy metal efflux RND transporter [Nitrospira sp.]
MIDAIISFSIRQRIVVLVLAVCLVLGGLHALTTITIDAFPDVTNVQVQILTEQPGLSPEEIERFVTFPIELQMTGLPGLEEIRSLSKFGLSQITVVFTDATDIYFARQLVLERLITAKEQLPRGAEPTMAPVSTGLGEIYQYYLVGPTDEGTVDLARRQEILMEERTIQDWIVRPLLKGLPGVIDVNSLGGFVKQYQVVVDPAKLRKFNLTVGDVFTAVEQNNANAGGNVLDQGDERLIIRGVGLLNTIEDIKSIVVKEAEGTPVFIHDVAEVHIGHAIRHGAAVLNGEREVVTGTVLMLLGGNAGGVVEAVKARVAEIDRQHLLPNGVRIVPFYDRSELVSAALATVRTALLEGIAFVVLVLFVFLGNVRSALIVTATLVVTPLTTFIIMDYLGLSANLMSLGGLAIAVGMMVDGSVVVVENIYRILSEGTHRPEDRARIVWEGAREVGRPVVFGIIIIIIVFLPLISLQGMEGKLFAPLAYTVIIALMVSLVLSLTLSPVLCLPGLRASGEADTWPVHAAKRLYNPVLRWALAHRLSILGGAGVLLFASLCLVPFLGGEFIPILDEGALTPQVLRLPDVSLERSIEMEKDAQRAILEFPEVTSIVSKLGRSEIAVEPMEPNESDAIVGLTPRSTWKTAATKDGLVEAMRKRLDQIPGIAVLMSQPIQERVDELISGVKTEVAVKLFGDDLAILKTKADEIASVLQGVRGVRDLKVEQQAGQGYLTIMIDRQRIARHGLNVRTVQDVIETAIGGKVATQMLEGERRFAVTVRFPESYRNNIESIGRLLIETPAHAHIPLGQLASIKLLDGPAHITRERVKRRISVGLNVVGRDIKSVVAEGQQLLSQQVVLPDGYRIEWGGAFENMERAMARLSLIVPVTIVLIFFMLFSSFNSVWDAGLILLNLPLALIGGIVALWITGQYLSVPASVGFIALFGVAVLNGVVLVSYFNKLVREGMPLHEAVLTGCQLRLRPVLMTALVALLGLLPIAFSEGIGSEVQRPLAVVVIGGLVSSTLLTLVVLPVLYEWMGTKRGRNAGAAARLTP